MPVPALGDPKTSSGWPSDMSSSAVAAARSSSSSLALCTSSYGEGMVSTGVSGCWSPSVKYQSMCPSQSMLGTVSSLSFNCQLMSVTVSNSIDV